MTETSPRTIVRGRSVSGLAVGIPVAVLVPLASVVVGTVPWTGVVFATTGVVMCLAATLFAVGLGAAYPIYEEREFWGTETVVPSTLVMMAYVAVVGAGALVGLIAVWYALAGSLVVTPVTGAGIGLYLLLTASLSYGSYRYAVRRYRRYVLG